jgi:mRNA interferase MazF
MGVHSAGEIVFVSFSFSDLTRSKLRPAVLLADAERGDFVLCQITSKPYADKRAIEITETDFAKGSLKVTSYARPAKLFTANKSLFATQVGETNKESLKKIVDGITDLLNESLS